MTSEEQRLAAENLYRDANTLIYGDSKPSEDAIDRVVNKINMEYVLPRYQYSDILSKLTRWSSIDKKGKFSRKRPNKDEGDITYINEHNRVFNKKVYWTAFLLFPLFSLTHYQIARYYDKYTTEIRASFERGTAL